jgi:hypothetical protein
MSKRRYLAVGGIVVAAVLLSTLLYTVLGNHSPVITGLQATPEMVSPGGTCQVACNVTGPEGDELSYNWSASGGEITGKGAAVSWTAPRSPGSYNVTVAVTGARSGKATAYRTITVNTPPTIISLVAGASWATPLSSVRLICTASDPDHDALIYEWTADGGDVSGTGAAVNWTAPQAAGAYNITVVVGDGHGGQATGQLSLSVNLGIPPTIEKLVVTPVANKYLRNSATAGCDFDVYMNKEYTIECVASNASGELFYQWSCTDGEASGQGQRITWIAPDKLSTGTVPVKVTVTVTVHNEIGNSIARSVVFHMASCTCGSWPLKSGEVLF